MLEKQFPDKQGNPTIFPRRKDGGSPDVGMVKALSTFYADRKIFNLASACLPWNKFDSEFVDDRSKVSFEESNEIRIPSNPGISGSALLWTFER